MISLRRILSVYTAVVYLFVLLPVIWVVYLTFFPEQSAAILVPETFTTKWFRQAFQDSVLVEAVRTSLLVSVVCAVVATVLGLLGARAYLKLDETKKKYVLLYFLFPVVIPGIVYGISLLSFFSLLNIETGTLTILPAVIMWSFPFAFLVNLTAMSNLNRQLRMVSYDLGAGKWETFRRVELPIVFPGILGAFLFSFVLSMNEYSRSFYVSGRSFTLPTFIFSSVQGATIPGEVYGVSTISIVVTVILLALYLVFYNRYSRGMGTNV